MRISDAIEILRSAAAEYGDIAVGTMNHEYGCAHTATITVERTNRKAESKDEFRDGEELGDVFVRFA